MLDIDNSPSLLCCNLNNSNNISVYSVTMTVAVTIDVLRITSIVFNGKMVQCDRFKTLSSIVL